MNTEMGKSGMIFRKSMGQARMVNNLEKVESQCLMLRKNDEALIGKNDDPSTVWEYKLQDMGSGYYCIAVSSNGVLLGYL